MAKGLRFGAILIDTPEKEMLSAVLMQAHLDMRGGAGATTSDAVDAYRWVIDREPMFLLVCDALGLDAETVRAALIRAHAPRCEAILRSRSKEGACQAIH